MTLYIDTRDKNSITVSLKIGDQIIDTLKNSNEFGSQVLLSQIKEIFKKNKFSFNKLKEIEVETGPGSFTGIRVGVSVANALGFSLGVLVNGKKAEIDLEYS